jgi:hypothetical protein
MLSPIRAACAVTARFIAADIRALTYSVLLDFDKERAVFAEIESKRVAYHVGFIMESKRLDESAE